MSPARRRRDADDSFGGGRSAEERERARLEREERRAARREVEGFAPEPSGKSPRLGRRGEAEASALDPLPFDAPSATVDDDPARALDPLPLDEESPPPRRFGPRGARRAPEESRDEGLPLSDASERDHRGDRPEPVRDEPPEDVEPTWAPPAAFTPEVPDAGFATADVAPPSDEPADVPDSPADELAGSSDPPAEEPGGVDPPAGVRPVAADLVPDPPPDPGPVPEAASPPEESHAGAPGNGDEPAMPSEVETNSEAPAVPEGEAPIWPDDDEEPILPPVRRRRRRAPDARPAGNGRAGLNGGARAGAPAREGRRFGRGAKSAPTPDPAADAPRRFGRGRPETTATPASGPAADAPRRFARGRPETPATPPKPGRLGRGRRAAFSGGSSPGRSAAPPPPPPAGRHGRKGDGDGGSGRRGPLIALIAGAVLIALLLFAANLLGFMGGGDGGEGEVRVAIPEGSSVGQIGDVLEGAGVIPSSFAFQAQATLGGSRADLKAGDYRLPVDAPYDQVIERLSAGPEPVRVETVDVTIPEGLAREEVAPIVEEAGLEGDYERASRRSRVLDPEDYGAEDAESLEGFLFPSTYELREGASARTLVNRQLRAFKREFDEVSMRAARRRNLTPYDVLIIASMIEREVSVPSERRLVSSVIYNRLRAGQPLGIDATTRFATGNWERPLRESELAIDSPYNTRTNAGLPPGPIGSPGIDSIRAAARPADTDYLYYVVKPCTEGEHAFSETEAEFEANRQAYEAERARQGGRAPTDC